MSKASKDVGRPLAVKPSLDAIAESQKAEWRVDYYRRHADIAAEQVVGLSKWLTASLFAANSGGLLTLINAVDKIGSPVVTGAFFIGGLVFALLSATANQEYYTRASEPLLNLTAYWQEVQILGEPDENRLNELNAAVTRLNRWTWIGPTFGWLSGVAFISGTIAIAIGLK